MSFNPNQDQQFCGRESLHFFTDLAQRRVSLRQYSNEVVNQANESACTGLAPDVQLDAFSGYRGTKFDLSWSFMYWIGRALEQGNSFTGEDTGLQEVASVFRALNLQGACLQSLAPDLSAGTRPSDAAFADAATRKVGVFERIDVFDCKNAVITALSHGLPIAGKFPVTWPFANLTSPDPVVQMAAYHYPGGRIFPGMPEFLGYHFMPIIGYDLDLNCCFVQNSWGTSWCSGGVGAIDLDTMVAQMMQGYVVREFAGMTSYVDPKWVVARNANHDSAYMLMLRRYMLAVLTRKDLTQLQMSQITRDAMPLYGASAQDLADSAEPWGVTLQMVQDFLALSAPGVAP